MMGGASQAHTRLTTSSPWAPDLPNSNVAVNLRLVASVQVSHPDTGSNQTALEQLTGSNGQSNVTVPASLQPLRNARETYGADLVALVRRFRDADHEGCGIAWLVGGNQTPITQPYEKFGYSVISDSKAAVPETALLSRRNPGHELAHNMGSQHDREATDENNQLTYGRYPSLRLQTTAANGTSTHDGLWRLRPDRLSHFSNPQSTYCGGRACGIATRPTTRAAAPTHR